MSHTERIIGDPKGITRRQVVKGAITAAVALFLSSGIGGVALGLSQKAKDFITNRTTGLYNADASAALRTSHSNPDVIKLYEDFLSPGSVQPATTELSHRLCHTVYGDKIPAHIEELKSIPVEEARAESIEMMKKLKASEGGK